MANNDFIDRIRRFGWKNILLSKDMGISVIIGIALLLMSFSPCDTQKTELLDTIITVSAALFSIILTGLAIITTFTDTQYIKIWIEIGQYDNVITLFQFNLYLPLCVLMISFINRFFVIQSDIFLYFTVASFFYLLLSLFDLIKFISKYALQRGEFIRLIP